MQKIELHRHLELCWRESTLLELAPQVGISVHSAKDLESEFYMRQPMKDLGAALKKFLNYQRLLSSPELLERMAYEAAEDACKVEDIKAIEFRYAPTFCQQANPKNSFTVIHEAIVRGLTRAEKDFPIATGLICIVQRILSVDVAREVVDFAIGNKKTFIALDLADNEDGFDSKPFAPLFDKAKAAGLGITIHAGEANLPKAPRYVREAIDYLGAQRIGHGLQIHRDPSVMDYVKSKGVTLEICPTSNWLTSAVESLTAHPLKKLMAAGVKTTLNTDDPTPFCTDLNIELEIAKSKLGLTEADIEMNFKNAREASFIPREKLDRVLGK